MSNKSPGQRNRVADRKRIQNLDSSIQSYLAGDSKMPVLRKPPSIGIQALFQKYNLDAHEFYPATMSEQAKAELHRERKSKWRDNYGKEAVQSTNLYKSTGEQAQKAANYKSLDEESKLAEHEEYFINKEVKQGFRCGICSEFFRQSEPRINHTVDGTTIYFHPKCAEAINKEFS